MKIKVILENAPDCELDSTIIENRHAKAADDLSDQIIEAISAWTLSVGDTIKIVEV